MDLILYSTEGCHLCEQAEAIYQSLKLQTKLILKDIAFDDELFSRYGVTIPVLSLQNNVVTTDIEAKHNSEDREGRVIDELCWPFDFEQLHTWLTKHGIN